MPTTDIVFALTGEIRRNSRALKQLRVLASLGARVEVLDLASASAQDLPTDVHLQALGRPAGRGPRFFSAVHRLFSATARQYPAKVYHASDLYALPAMCAAARQHAGSLVYDARELYPHVASTIGRPWVSALWHTIEKRYIRRTDAVFTVSDPIAEKIARTYDVPRPSVLHNVPVYSKAQPAHTLRAAAGIEPDSVVLLHQGNIQKHRGCEYLLDAMLSVRGAVLVFLGGGPMKPCLQQLTLERHVMNRVRFLNSVPPTDLLPLTACADIGITLLEGTCLNHRLALPNKLFEYLMAGLPVLASNLPGIGGLVKRFDVGRVVDPKDPAALVETLQGMVNNREARIRWANNTPSVLEHFSWEMESQRFRAVYAGLLLP